MRLINPHLASIAPSGMLRSARSPKNRKRLR